MAQVWTYEVTIDDDDSAMLIPPEVRVAALLRMMGKNLENSEHAQSVGYSVGRDFECIKLKKKETI